MLPVSRLLGRCIAVVLVLGPLAVAVHGQEPEDSQWESNARASLHRVAAERQRLLAEGDHRGAELLAQVLDTLEETLADHRRRERLPPPRPVNHLAVTGPVLLAANAQDETTHDPSRVERAAKPARHNERRRDDTARIEKLERDVAELQRTVARLQRERESRQGSSAEARGRDQRQTAERLRSEMRRVDQQLAESQRRVDEVARRIEELSKRRHRIRQELESMPGEEEPERRRAQGRGPELEEPARWKHRRDRE